MLKDIENYWTHRAEGYSEVNKGELATTQKDKWLKEIEKRLGEKKKETISILDVGCGPGFFSIILAEAGYKVTAIDYTEAMIEEAEKNAGKLADKIKFIKMDAQNLLFDNEYFDVVVSRNLTWNLEEPAKAYGEWVRVLKNDGILLNFDANWYHHLFDDKKKEAYENDRKMVASKNLADHYNCTDIDTMEDIAREMPLSKKMRPDWDCEVLQQLEVQDISIDNNIWQQLWSQEEKINYGSTPMFLVEVRK